jgi:hopanoid-associated phosphorylase
MPVIAVTGLRVEAKLAAGPRVLVMSGGGDGAALARALATTAADKASAIISFGVAGGLAPGLAPGSSLVARSIITESGERFDGDPAWSLRLSAALGGAPIVDMAGVDSPVVDHEAKRALHAKTGAYVADMESHIAARVAAAYRLPFAAFRVVSDPAERRLPHAALVGMQSDGTLALGAVARSLLRDPRQVPQLLRTALDASAAFGALFRGRQMLAGALGFTDFSELMLDLPVEEVIRGPLQI